MQTVGSTATFPSFSQFSKTLNDFEKTEIKKALVAFPVGRALLNKAFQKKAQLEDTDKAMAELSSIVGKMSLSISDLERVNHMIQHVELVDVRATAAITQELLQKVLENFLLAVVLEFFQGGLSTEDHNQTYVEGTDIMLWATKLVDAQAMHRLHSETESYIQVYKDAQSLIGFAQSVQDFNRDTLNQDLAAQLLVGLSSFDNESLLYKEIHGHLGQSWADQVQSWHDRTLASPVGDSCRELCNLRTQELETSAKEMIKGIFVHTVAIPKDVNPWTSFQLKGDFMTSLSVLRSLPRQEVLINELCFLDLFGRVAKLYASWTLWSEKTPVRKERRISDSRVKELTNLRTELKLLEEFVQQRGNRVMNSLLHEQKQDIRNSMACRSAYLGVRMDLTDLPRTIASVHSLVETVVADWTKDAADLTALVQSWTIGDWELHKPKILHPENKEIVKSLLENPNYSRCSKGAAMLNTWRNLLKLLNRDGCGMVVPVENIKQIQTAVRNASEYCEMTFALHNVLTVIPQVKNINTRKADAKKFMQDMKSRCELGEDLLTRLQAIAANGTVVQEGRRRHRLRASRMRWPAIDEHVLLVHTNALPCEFCVPMDLRLTVTDANALPFERSRCFRVQCTSF